MRPGSVAHFAAGEIHILRRGSNGGRSSSFVVMGRIPAQDPRKDFRDFLMCNRVDQLLTLGMVILPLIWNYSIGYIDPYGLGLMTISEHREQIGV